MRLRILLMLVGAVLVVATFTFPTWQPLIQDQTVAQEEAFPGLAPQLQASFLNLPQEQQRAFRELAEENRQKAVTMVTAAVAPRVTLPDEEQEMPQMSSPVTAASGTFARIDAVRWAQGTVNIYRQADNSLVMRFEGFSMLNGPDLRVYLSSAEEPATFAEMGSEDNEPIEVQPLKASDGSQNYNLPSSVDMSTVRSVVIYSPTVDYVYSYAPLFVRQ